MRRFWVPILLAIFPLAAPAQELTCEQVLRMGYERWMEHHGETVGWSTADVVEGSTRYGDCLKQRNDRLLAERDEAERAVVKQLREAMGVFSRRIVDVGSQATGGGTIWAMIDAGYYPRQEEAVYGYLVLQPQRAGRNAPQPKQLSAQSVREDIAALRSEVVAGRASLEELREGSAAEALTALEQASETYEAFVKGTIPSVPVARRQAIYRFFAQCITDIRDMYSPDRE